MKQTLMKTVRKLLLIILTNSSSVRTNKLILILWFLLSILFFETANSMAATYYVRAGAAGANNGADWTNAYTTLPSSLNRGSTYYIADGTYAGYDFDDPEAGTSIITIKKATVADHGINTGWNDTYGDGQAVFNGTVEVHRSYIVLDGNDSIGYGFKITNFSTVGLLVPSSTYVYSEDLVGLIFRSIEITPGSNSVDEVGIHLKTHAPNDLLIQHVEVYSVGDDCLSMQNGQNIIIDDFYCHSRNTLTGAHADGIQANTCNNITVKNSRFNWNGQQIFWGGVGSPAEFSGWKIYGNIFYGGLTAGKGLHPHSNATFLDAVKVYNNTFYDLNISSDLGGNGDYRNNIFYNVNATMIGSNHAYNYFKTGMSITEATGQWGGDPFVNAALSNFQLSIATNAGDSSIGALYNTDPNRIPRGGDGVWDRGAYEFNSGVVYTIPRPPSGLSVE